MFLLELSNALPPGFNFKDLLDEIARADIPYRRHYSEYQSGGWWTCSLLGRTADATDGAVTDTGRPVETDALDRLPLTRRFLEDLGLRYMMVRLARLDPGGALWEHRDYQDLSRASRQRIHLPIDTNPGALFVSAGCRFHMKCGSLQTFRPTIAHGACNAGNHARLHLMIDVHEDAHLKKLLAGAMPLTSQSMPQLSPAALADTVRCLRMTLANRHDDTERDAACQLVSTLGAGRAWALFRLLRRRGRNLRSAGARVSGEWSARARRLLGRAASPHARHGACGCVRRLARRRRQISVGSLAFLTT